MVSKGTSAYREATLQALIADSTNRKVSSPVFVAVPHAASDEDAQAREEAKQAADSSGEIPPLRRFGQQIRLVRLQAQHMTLLVFKIVSKISIRRERTAVKPSQESESSPSETSGRPRLSVSQQRRTLR